MEWDRNSEIYHFFPTKSLERKKSVRNYFPRAICLQQLRINIQLEPLLQWTQQPGNQTNKKYKPIGLWPFTSIWNDGSGRGGEGQDYDADCGLPPCQLSWLLIILKPFQMSNADCGSVFNSIWPRIVGHIISHCFVLHHLCGLSQPLLLPTSHPERQDNCWGWRWWAGSGGEDWHLLLSQEWNIYSYWIRS